MGVHVCGCVGVWVCVVVTGVCLFATVILREVEEHVQLLRVGEAVLRTAGGHHDAASIRPSPWNGNLEVRRLRRTENAELKDVHFWLLAIGYLFIL